MPGTKSYCLENVVVGHAGDEVFSLEIGHQQQQQQQQQWHRSAPRGIQARDGQGKLAGWQIVGRPDLADRPRPQGQQLHRWVRSDTIHN